MLASVLKSKTAIEISIQIMDTFVQMRTLLSSHGQLIHQIDRIAQKQTSFELEAREKFEAIFSALEDRQLPYKQGVFFDGQVFDAHVFVSDLIRQAKKSIILLDNYIDDTVLAQFSKANQTIKIYLLTKNVSNVLKQDITKYNAQYGNITRIDFHLAHDRFFILDEKAIYHIGASLKDLGKKWFAFSKLEADSFGLMKKIHHVIEANGVRG